MININDVKAGSWVKDSNGVPWIKIEDDEDCHIEGMVINLFNGSGCHISRLPQPIEYTSALEIVW